MTRPGSRTTQVSFASRLRPRRINHVSLNPMRNRIAWSLGVCGAFAVIVVACGSSSNENNGGAGTDGGLGADGTNLGLGIGDGSGDPRLHDSVRRDLSHRPRVRAGAVRAAAADLRDEPGLRVRLVLQRFRSVRSVRLPAVEHDERSQLHARHRGRRVRTGRVLFVPGATWGRRGWDRGSLPDIRRCSSDADRRELQPGPGERLGHERTAEHHRAVHGAGPE